MCNLQKPHYRIPLHIMDVGTHLSNNYFIQNDLTFMFTKALQLVKNMSKKNKHIPTHSLIGTFTNPEGVAN